MVCPVSQLRRTVTARIQGDWLRPHTLGWPLGVFKMCLTQECNELAISGPLRWLTPLRGHSLMYHLLTSAQGQSSPVLLLCCLKSPCL